MVSHEVDLVVTGGIVLTADQDWNVYDPGAVAVDGGAIVGLGPRKEVERAYRGRERIDAGGKLVMPGLINAHTHAPMTLFRGIADDLPLETWLHDYIWPAEAKWLSQDFVRLGTQLAAAEMIRSGTILFCDMYFFEDDIAEACKDAGLRVVVGGALVDFPNANYKTPGGTPIQRGPAAQMGWRLPGSSFDPAAQPVRRFVGANAAGQGAGRPVRRALPAPRVGDQERGAGEHREVRAHTRRSSGRPGCP